MRRPAIPSPETLARRAAASTTPAARALSDALAARTHLRSAGTHLLGSSSLRRGVESGRRRRKQVRSAGWSPSPDALELGHVHGRVLPALQRAANASAQEGASIPCHATVWPVAGAAWSRLCLDTKAAASTWRPLRQVHLDIAVIPSGSPADLSLFLSGAQEREVLDAVARLEPAPAAGGRRATRLFLLGDGRVAVSSGGRRVSMVDGGGVDAVGCLLLVDGRLTQAEVWLAERPNRLAAFLAFATDLMAAAP